MSIHDYSSRITSATAAAYEIDKAFVESRRALLEASGFTVTYDDAARVIVIHQTYPAWVPPG